jgi:RNA polymerase sigma factor (sigma-70 family)
LAADDDLYLVHADVIESVLRYSSRSHHLSADDADEFSSWARLRLLDHDQAILRKFGGRSAVRTFLVSVVERLFLDWRNHEWGKWRPTSEARRLGQLAIELERLVLRDGTEWVTAVEILLQSGVAPSAAECDRVWARLPRHPRRQRVDAERLVEQPSALPAADPVEVGEHRARDTAILAALDDAVGSLPASDRVLIQLRYWSGVKVSQIAATTGLDQKQLYRRFDKIWADLRDRLAQAGVTVADLAGPLTHFDLGDGPSPIHLGKVEVVPSNLGDGGGPRA